MKTLTIAALTLAMITAASAQTSTTFRDASGRSTGTASRPRRRGGVAAAGSRAAGRAFASHRIPASIRRE
jgi:hypothetical protein